MYTPETTAKEPLKTMQFLMTKLFYKETRYFVKIMA
jgi:hypothetical protein